MNDLMATGFMDAALNDGVRIPEDVSVIGFDNRQECRFTRPRLTTVDIPLEKMGEKAGQVLLDLISGKTPENRKVILPCEFLEKIQLFKSTGGNIMRKKILKVMMCAITTMTLLAGCGSSNTGSTTGSAGDTAAEDTAETADFAGTKLVIGVESGSPNIEFFKNNVSEFESATGITVEWVEIPHDNMHERFVQEAISQSGAIDIYDTDQPWISEFASKDIWSRWETSFQRRIKVISMKLH